MARKAEAGLSDAERAVAKVVKAIPRGQLSSYGQVAKRAGLSAGARGVARALGRVEGLPWWRVIRSDGTLAPEVAAEQARRLRKEGVEVKGRRVLGARPPEAKASASRAGLRQTRAPAISAKPRKGRAP